MVFDLVTVAQECLVPLNRKSASELASSSHEEMIIKTEERERSANRKEKEKLLEEVRLFSPLLVRSLRFWFGALMLFLICVVDLDVLNAGM